MFNSESFKNLVDSKTDDIYQEFKQSVCDALLYGCGIAVIKYDANTDEITIENKNPTDIVYMEFKK